jgi:carbon-monoxide dehydrogenase medium subunit
VKPAPFVHHAPDSVEEAIGLLHQHGDEAKVLAGGQSLLPLMAMRLATPARVVDIGRIATLRHVEPTPRAADGTTGLRIPAGVTLRTAERSQVVRATNPLLAAALPHVAHPPIRNRGTVCGSLAHADPAAELPAVLAASDGSLTVRSTRGTRTIAAADLYRSYLDTSIEPDELVIHVDLPAWPPGAGWSFQELARRPGYFALAGVAVVLVHDADGGVDARIAACGVGATPVRLLQAEAAARRVRLSAAAEPADRRIDVGGIVDAARTEVDPPTDVHATGAYRRHVLGVLVRRALIEATGRAEVTA